MKKISVCLVVRNGEKYIGYIDSLFTEIEALYRSKFEFEYFIYENNSTDDTKKRIEIFAQNHNQQRCRVFTEDVPNSGAMRDGISIERGIHMAIIRNKLKDFHGAELDSDYTLLLDCDVVFLPDTIEKLVSSFDGADVSMVSAYAVCWTTYINSNRNYIHYYDSLALISSTGISYKEDDNTCLFRKCVRCIRHRNMRGIGIDASKLLDDDECLVRVRSAFGSMALVKTETYNKVRWGNSVCEHHSFCDSISKISCGAGAVAINPTIKIFTTIPIHRDYESIRQDLLLFK